MSTPTSRRQFLGMGAQVGATIAASIGFSRPGEAAVQPMAPDLRGPYLDLSTPRGNNLTLARLI